MAEIRIAQIVGKWLGGGVESVVMNYYRNIDRTKIQFDFFCDEDSTNIPYDEIRNLGGKVILIPPYQKVFEYQKVLKAELKKGNYKIVHSHINTLSVFPLRAAKKVGVPVRISHSHSTTNKKEWKKNIVKQILRPFSKKYANQFMCCSELAGKWMFGKKFYNENVYLLNNAIDIEKFSFNPELRSKIRNELNISDNTFVIGHIGRFVAQKNHSFLIEILREYLKLNPDVVLLLAGQGPGMVDVRNLVCEYKLDQYVKFLNQRNDAYALYNAFDAFVLPSLYEGLPVVGVEAQCNDLNCYLSSDMTKETKILEKTLFLNLSDRAETWAKKIYETSDKNRFDNSQIMKEKGFSITDESGKLEKYYINKFNK